ncbi:VOC family protein [Psychroserpens luteolus]|uniref:VOC family protein n=1 Tax=Psychroserpens luteolus TaxID=2855840 RepID=UPI001E2DE8B4|nr:VOC family protein [Psychroserpens luteolus]MCD2260882.1 glyoxalase/bleomycin resistance/extradiol dioxygenase family protein [Psychroserpens luteolus]
MSKAFLKQIHPVLPVRHVMDAVNYYVNKLGFKLAFKDVGDHPGYAGVIRDGIEIHLQWHDENDWTEGMDSVLLRIYVDEVDALFEEYKTTAVFHQNTNLSDTTWGTREFGIYDENKNGLVFYRDL